MEFLKKFSRYNASLTELDDNLTASDNHKFEFMTDGDGNYGYRGADDSFVPFSSSVVKGLYIAYSYANQNGSNSLKAYHVVSTNGQCALFSYSNYTYCLSQFAADVNSVADWFEVFSGTGTDTGAAYLRLKKTGYYILGTYGYYYQHYNEQQIYYPHETATYLTEGTEIGVDSTYIDTGNQLALGLHNPICIVYLGETNPFE